MNSVNIDNSSNENIENILKKVFNNTKTNFRIIKYDNLSNGKYIDLFNKESSNKTKSANFLEVSELYNKLNV